MSSTTNTDITTSILSKHHNTDDNNMKKKLTTSHWIIVVLVVLVCLMCLLYMLVISKKVNFSKFVNETVEKTSFKPTIFKIYDLSTKQACNRLIIVEPFTWYIWAIHGRLFILNPENGLKCFVGSMPAVQVFATQFVETCLKLDMNAMFLKYINGKIPIIVPYEITDTTFTVISALNILVKNYIYFDAFVETGTKTLRHFHTKADIHAYDQHHRRQFNNKSITTNNNNSTDNVDDNDDDNDNDTDNDIYIPNELHGRKLTNAELLDIMKKPHSKHKDHNHLHSHYRKHINPISGDHMKIIHRWHGGRTK